MAADLLLLPYFETVTVAKIARDVYASVFEIHVNV
jgi:hypothetical protein